MSLPLRATSRSRAAVPHADRPGCRPTSPPTHAGSPHWRAASLARSGVRARREHRPQCVGRRRPVQRRVGALGRGRRAPAERRRAARRRSRSPASRSPCLGAAAARDGVAPRPRAARRPAPTARPGCRPAAGGRRCRSSCDAAARSTSRPRRPCGSARGARGRAGRPGGLRAVKMTSSSRHFSSSYRPSSQIVTLPPPYSPARDRALERRVVHRVVLGHDREVVALVRGRHAARHRPADEHSVTLQPEVPMQRGGVVLLDDEDRQLARRGARRCGIGRHRFGRLPAVRLAM